MFSSAFFTRLNIRNYFKFSITFLVEVSSLKFLAIDICKKISCLKQYFSTYFFIIIINKYFLILSNQILLYFFNLSHLNITVDLIEIITIKQVFVRGPLESEIGGENVEAHFSVF